MSFSQIIGQNRPKEILHRALETGRLPHACLFAGPDGAGKQALAIELAKAVFCRGNGDKPCDACDSCSRAARFAHPDFIFIFPMPKTAEVEEERRVLDSMVLDPYARLQLWAAPTIGIERIRELRRVSNLKPLEGHRVVIIAEADKMTIEASNALLKILEEPPPEMHLILTTARANALLPTIVSRCQRVDFHLLSDAEIISALEERRQIPAPQAQLVARIAQGSYARALELLQEDLPARRDLAVEALRLCLRDELTQLEWVEKVTADLDKREIRDLLTLLLVWFRDALLLFGKPQGFTSDQLVNVDKLDILEKFVNSFDAIHFDAIFAELARAIDLVDRNVQVQLILIVLLARLQNSLIIKGSNP